MAPEVIEHKPYDERADVFSFGVVLWELLTCKIPYSDMTPLQVGCGRAGSSAFESSVGSLGQGWPPASFPTAARRRRRWAPRSQPNPQPWLLARPAGLPAAMCGPCA